MRRKRARLLDEMTADPPEDSEGKFTEEDPFLRRLGTHIWHAKRMEMTERWVPPPFSLTFIYCDPSIVCAADIGSLCNATLAVVKWCEAINGHGEKKEMSHRRIGRGRKAHFTDFPLSTSGGKQNMQSRNVVHLPTLGIWDNSL